MVNRHGPQIRAIVSTSVSPAVTRRCLEAGMALYWWNPILDDVEDPTSLTRRLFDMNKVPCMVTGGNVGSAAWVFAHQVLAKQEVIIVGMDLGYPSGTPLEKTQYYKELHELFGGRVQDTFIPVYNPHLRERWYTDPAYYWYRQEFLRMAPRADCMTYNCTEGGTLFGKGLKWAPLQEFLRGRRRAQEGR